MFKEKGQPLSIEEVELKEPIEGEVLIKVQACGVCHSDYLVKEGHTGNSLSVHLPHRCAAMIDLPPVLGFQVTK